MKSSVIVPSLVFAFATASAMDLSSSRNLKVIASTKGIYHAAFPDIPIGAQRGIKKNVRELEALIEKPIAWVYFQNDFTDGLSYPAAAVKEILELGKIPFLRMMPRSRRGQNHGADPVYRLARFTAGDFDSELRAWARAAKAEQKPLMVEFGPECNGRWFSWNGAWNGGAEAFRSAYRHIIDLFRREGVRNVTWVFHADAQPNPREPWNRMSGYYPGNDYIDWIGISVFGAQRASDYWDSFTAILDKAWPEIEELSKTKPVAIVEWGVSEKSGSPKAKAQWVEEAMRAVLGGRYPRIRAMSYWHEKASAMNEQLNLGLNSSAAALEAYNLRVRDARFLSKAEIAKK